MMKLSKVFHVLGAVTGMLGVIALLAAWYAGSDGVVLGMSQDHLFKDATVLVLIAIWLQLAVIHHMKLEDRGEII